MPLPASPTHSRSPAPGDVVQWYAQRRGCTHIHEFPTVSEIMSVAPVSNLCIGVMNLSDGCFDRCAFASKAVPTDGWTLSVLMLAMFDVFNNCYSAVLFILASA